MRLEKNCPHFAAILIFCLSWIFIAVLSIVPPCQAAIPRNQPAVGIIAGASGDAQIRFVRESAWLQAASDQGLLAGDDLRTGPLGSMALLFADHTQIRVHRNSRLTIKAIAAAATGGSVFRLNQGGAWARSIRDDSGVRIETPSATAAIRGTDWSLHVDDTGRTTLVVLDGKVALENDFGRVFVSRGEIAVAEIGKAPNKTIIVAPDDRELIFYNLSLPDALKSISLTDLKTRDRRQAKARLEAIGEKDRTPEEWVTLAELAYDINDREMARQCLMAAGGDGGPALSARAALVRGYMAMADQEFEIAQKILAAAQDHLDPQRRLTAMMGRAGALILIREMEPVRLLLQQMTDEYNQEPRFLWFQVLLTAFAGDLPGAAAMTEKYGGEYPDQAIFPAAEGAIALLLNRREAAKAAAEKVLAIDPEAAFGFFILGTYQNDYLQDREAAIETFQKGLSFNRLDADLWGALANSYQEIDEATLAEEAFHKALSLAPKDLVFLCNYAILLLDQSRMDEAAHYIERLTAIEPSREIARILQGREALQTGRVPAAQDYFLKATTVNPAMPTASLGLAIAYYQNGQPDLADQALNDAGRLDPNDPEIPLVGATMALDQARADDAILYARQAIRKYQSVKGVGISGLAANRGGKNTLGGAFMNLSLNSWADYYNEASFDPYSPDSHFYRALQSDELSSLYQGLLLEPLAVSARNRNVDFYRRPFVDSAIGGSVNWPDKGPGYTASSDIQGFDQSWVPLSYFLSVEGADFPGDLENAEKQGMTGIGMAGMNLSPRDRVIVGLSGSDSDTGLPGTRSNPDPDDELREDLVRGEIGYSHSFGARNVFMSHMSVFERRSKVRNADPLGVSLSAVDYSLIANFGVDAARLLHEAGLIDVTDPNDPDTPLLMVGDFAPPIASTIPTVLDTKTASEAEVIDTYLGLNCRHMFTAETVDYSYGAEAIATRKENKLHLLEFSQRDPGLGMIFGTDQSMPFLFGDPAPATRTSKQLGLDGNAHVNALWRIDKTLWIEGGSFVFRYDNDAGTRFTRMAPRAGIAWQGDDKDWLRIMARKDVALPGISSLAPTATVGLFNDMAYVAEGGRSTRYQARWDREWFAHLFTALSLSCQDIREFSASPGDNSFETYGADRGRINSLGLAVNLWIRGGFGVFADSVFRKTENRGRGVDGRPDLPLVPRNEIRTGIVWVHPAQIRASLSAGFIGERPGEPSAGDLDDYVTTDLSLSWQPFDKHLEVGCAVANLLDVDYDQATDMPGPGRVVSVSAEVRF